MKSQANFTKVNITKIYQDDVLSCIIKNDRSRNMINVLKYMSLHYLDYLQRDYKCNFEKLYLCVSQPIDNKDELLIINMCLN